jgi:hypothetical protein
MSSIRFVADIEHLLSQSIKIIDIVLIPDSWIIVEPGIAITTVAMTPFCHFFHQYLQIIQA